MGLQSARLTWAWLMRGGQADEAMRNVRWYVSGIEGLDPDAAPESSRRVIVVARYDAGGLDAHVAGHEFELWIPAGLTDLATIEREAFRALREHLTVLLSSLPGGPWPRSVPRPN